MIVYIAWDEAEGKPREFVRICPACQEPSVIGHGWRDRRADDHRHTTIRIRRGLCTLCQRTITMLPPWLIPGGHYSWTARRQAKQMEWEDRLAIEQCAPPVADPDRAIDPSTLRRWFRRRWESLVLGLWEIFAPPTLFAWDWKAARRILIAEADSP
jgi:Domain of unknown function (DUF6431)